jgi:hypothetical protein
MGCGQDSYFDKAVTTLVKGCFRNKSIINSNQNNGPLFALYCNPASAMCVLHPPLALYMRLERILLVISIALLVIAIWTTSRACRNTTAGATLAAAAATSPSSANDLDSRLKKLETSSPDPGTLMLEIQLHFAKLYYAGEARNWDLATFERNEIEGLLGKVAVLRPAENNVKIDEIINTFKQTPFTAVKDAIDVKDRKLFRQAYNDSLAMCNACHQATGRPFIAIITPTNAPVSNQRWTTQ